MKLFMDTANLEEIREASRWGVLRGVTTNPTHVANEEQDFLPLQKEICSIVEGEVSIETTSDDIDTLIDQAHDIAQIADNAVVKIALTPTGCLLRGLLRRKVSRSTTRYVSRLHKRSCPRKRALTLCRRL